MTTAEMSIASLIEQKAARDVTICTILWPTLIKDLRRFSLVCFVFHNKESVSWQRYKATWGT